ncbi:MAG: plasmid pRiA4b ORF-3 family protein [Spirochaetia bacterium]|nr:plasmid pRiA4b ORF-3 family protein [Spirochaetia bacterium]
MKLCQINVIGEKKKPQKNNGGVYKLYSELKGFKPKIHRTFLIKKNMPMLSLASCMISMFDGNASHIYDFDVPSENLNLQVYFDGEMNAFDDEFAIGHKHIQPKKYVDVRNYKVKDCLKKIGDKITFTYDFGDGWTFPIRLEEIIDDEVYEEAAPLVLDGEGHGIIEDVGGVGAMSDCVKAYEKKSGEDYESYSEWLGIKDLVITYFNKSAVNKSLKNEIKAIDKAYKTME